MISHETEVSLGISLACDAAGRSEGPPALLLPTSEHRPIYL